MDTDRAYLLGLIIGGGIFGNTEDVFRIRLPFRQWGSYTDNPQRAGQISQDVMKVVSPLFRAIYGLTISYDASESGAWNILCEGDLTSLKNELEDYGIICEGEVRKTANINNIIPLLVDDNLKRRFIAGLADTIGSTRNSHRRFNNEKQMISFEISGFCFNFVCSLCKLLHSIKCYPDQVLWNHPNFHCSQNPYDSKWKKGFKLRVYLDQYDKFGAFAFKSKAQSLKQNRALETVENEGIPCETREIKAPSITCVHCEENSILLPPEVQGGHYLHNRHICAVLHCPHAPFNEVDKLISNAEQYIMPFPVLVKGTEVEINNIIEQDDLLKNRNYTTQQLQIRKVYETSITNSNKLLFEKEKGTGYPINKLILAITYLLAAKSGKLNGSRPKGSKDDIIKNYLALFPDASITIKIPDLLTPIIVSLDNYAALVGPLNPKVYKKLIHIDTNNKYKIHVSKITEEDLK